MAENEEKDIPLVGLPESQKYTGPENTMLQEPAVFVPRATPYSIAGGAAQTKLAPARFYDGNPNSVMSLPNDGQLQLAEQTASPAEDKQQPLQPLATVPVQPQQPAAAQDVTVTEGQRKKGLKLSDDIKQRIDNSYAESEAGAQLKAEADIKAAIAEAGALDEDHDAVQTIIGQRRAAQIRWDKEADRVRKEITDRTAAAEAKINPNRLWDEMDNGRKALAIVGIALGAFGAAVTKTPNDAIKILDAAIQRDIDAQKATSANAQHGIEIRRNSLHELANAGLRENESLLTQGKLMRESLISRLKAMAARAKVPAIQGAFLETAAGLERQNVAAEIERQKLIQDQVTTAWKTIPAAMQGGKTPDQIKEQREQRDYYRRAAADKESPAGRYLGTVQDLEDFKAFSEGGVPSVAVMNFIATALKQGSFGPNLKAMADSPSAFAGFMEDVRKKLAGGERPVFMEGIQKSLEAREKIAAARAKDFVEGMKRDGVNPYEILGSPTENEKALQSGGSYSRPK